MLKVDELPLKVTRGKEMSIYNYGSEKWPCWGCSRPVDPNKSTMLHLHLCGDVIVTEKEAEELNAAGNESADLGGFPIGPDCIKHLMPGIQPYLNGGK